MLTPRNASSAPLSSARRTRTPLVRAVAVSGASLVALAALTGCSFHASIGTTKTVSADKVATTAEDALEKAVGSRPEVTCPDDLKLEEGQTMRCELTDPASGTVYGMTVTVKDPDSENNLSFDVDETPKA